MILFSILHHNDQIDCDRLGKLIKYPDLYSFLKFLGRYVTSTFVREGEPM